MKRNITKNELFIIPLAQNIKFVKKVPLQGAVNLNHSNKDLSGEMLHAMMQPQLLAKHSSINNNKFGSVD